MILLTIVHISYQETLIYSTPNGIFNNDRQFIIYAEYNEENV